MGNDCSKGKWRNADQNLKWNLEFKNFLIEEIKAMRNFKNVTPCLMIAGPVATGKSSLVNTFLCAGQDKQIVRKASEGRDRRSFKVEYSRYVAAGELINKYRICDTMGILDRIDKGMTANDTISVMKGHIAPGYEFDEKTDIETPNAKYISDPPETDKSHCLVIVLSSEDLPTYQDNYRTKITKAIRACCKEDGVKMQTSIPSFTAISQMVKSISGLYPDSMKKSKKSHNSDKNLYGGYDDIPVCIVLTKVDKICKTVEKDNRKIFKCEHVANSVRETSELFGLPEGYIFPVINHSPQKEISLYNTIDIIALLTLKTLLQTASDFLEGPECK